MTSYKNSIIWLATKFDNIHADHWSSVFTAGVAGEPSANAVSGETHFVPVIMERYIMKLPRRRFLHLAAGATALPVVSRMARAQTYPTRPVRIVIGFAAGGPADITARLIAQWLSERLGQQFVVENRVGTGGNIAAEAVVRSPPDGYTLLHVTVSNAVNATLYEKLTFDLNRDIAPIASFNRTPAVMEVNPSFPAKTVPEFIAYAKANPGQINVASGGVGSASHLYAELFKMMTRIDFVQVHYRGSGPALLDLISGQVQAMFDPIISSIGYIRAGSLRPLAVTTATRLDVLPDIPTVADFVPGFEASGWQGIVAPRNTPIEIIGKLNLEVNAALIDPKFRARLTDLGAIVLAGSPADFGKHIANEIEKWGKVIRVANLKAE
jgi:tripartite-type tricarboxylate transporter receptor subunit TctC